MSPALPRLAFTCGDPAGVGPEIIATWLAAAPEAELGTVEIHGPARWLAALPRAGSFTARPVGEPDFIATPGAPTEAGACVADAALRSAAAAAREGRVAGVVTGPVAKTWMVRAGWGFPGQTEFFAAEWGGEPVMVFAGGRLRVALATWHIPLSAVPGALTAPVLARAVAAAAELCAAEGSQNMGETPLPPQNSAPPRIAVCGLNPHAGEDGLLGAEERDLIDPILDLLRASGFPGLSRCLPGDTVFGRQLRGEFDAVVALYHDQGLAPLKTLEFDQAVNLTLGLPFVRSSPDHGTGFDIAGRGLASATSFTNAVRLARALAVRRGRLRAAD